MNKLKASLCNTLSVSSSAYFVLIDLALAKIIVWTIEEDR